MTDREEVKSALTQFESLRFRQVCMSNIDDLHEMIRRGEILFELAPVDDFPDVQPYIVSQLIVPYWEIARYYCHRQSYSYSKHPKNIDASIEYYDRLEKMLTLEKGGMDKNGNYAVYLREVYEGRSECYLEIKREALAIIEANSYVNHFQDARAHCHRAKLFISLELFEQAKKDISVVIETAIDQEVMSNAIYYLQKKINLNK
jgi:hypothetical protein